MTHSSWNKKIRSSCGSNTTAAGAPVTQGAMISIAWHGSVLPEYSGFITRGVSNLTLFYCSIIIFSGIFKWLRTMMSEHYPRSKAKVRASLLIPKTPTLLMISLGSVFNCKHLVGKYWNTAQIIDFHRQISTVWALYCLRIWTKNRWK